MKWYNSYMSSYLLILLFCLIIAPLQSFGTCKRTVTKKILVDDIDVYLTHTYEKISNFFSFEEVETPDGLKIRIEQDGCHEYIERYIFTLPFGQTSPGNGNLLLQKAVSLLNQLKFIPKYKNPIHELVATLEENSKKSEHYTPGEEIKVKRKEGKEKVSITHSRHGANFRKITVTRIIDITWK